MLMFLCRAELKDVVGKTMSLGIAFSLFQTRHRCGCKVLNLTMLVVRSMLGEAWTSTLPQCQ